MTSRLSDKEARMLAIAVRAFGVPAGANYFRSFFHVTHKRANELQALQYSLTAEEAQQVKATLGDADAD